MDTNKYKQEIILRIKCCKRELEVQKIIEEVENRLEAENLSPKKKLEFWQSLYHDLEDNNHSSSLGDQIDTEYRVRTIAMTLISALQDSIKNHNRNL